MTVPLEMRWGGPCSELLLVAQVVSRLLAFSTALLSYSSQIFAVSRGVLGGARRSLNGEVVLASGDDWCGANAIVEAIFKTDEQGRERTVREARINECKQRRSESNEEGLSTRLR